MTTYSIVYIISEVFFVYILSLYYNVFFGARRVGRIGALASYVAYFVIADGLYFGLNDYRLNALINVLGMFLLTMLHEAPFKKRIAVVLMLYILLAILETISAVCIVNIALLKMDSYTECFCIIVIRILWYIVALLARNMKNIRQNIAVPISVWIAVLAVPICSIYLLFVMLFKQMQYFETKSFVACIVIILLIDVFMFYLYDMVIQYYNAKLQNELLRREKENYLAQLKSMIAHNEDIRAFRHDMRNHLKVLYSYIESDTEQAKKYLQEISGVLEVGKDDAQTGNVAADSILNYKLGVAKNSGIAVRTCIKIPRELPIADADWVAILGNLLDNALEAAARQPDAHILVRMEYEFGILRISVENSFDGKLVEKEGHLLTTKRDKSRHGIGLHNVERTAQKYQGILSVSHENGIFTATVLLEI